MNLNLKEAVSEYIKNHGYDGLRKASDQCYCYADDVNPCECLSEKCELWKGERPDEIQAT
jgi:hypothetical protein